MGKSLFFGAHNKSNLFERSNMILGLIGIIAVLLVFIIFAAGRSEKGNKFIWPFTVCFISFLVFLGYLAS